MICSHCHLEYDQDALFMREIDGKKEYFCCKGCEGVFRLLKSSNLDSFYDKLGSSKLAPPKDFSDDLARFDSEIFAQKFIKKIDSNKSEVALILEGIHCIACCWLNQKVLDNLDFIYEVSINYTNNKAKIIFNPQKIKLSQIIAKIRSIGYDAQAYDPKTLESINLKERREYYTKMIVGVFCSMNIMWIAIAQYLGYFLGMEGDIKHILNAAGFILCTPVLFYSGFIFFKGGYFGLKNGFINMDLLVSVGASITYIYSIYAAISQSGETYFESVCMIITFILIGKFLEVRSRKNAGDSIDKLINEIPSQINIIKDNISRAISPHEAKIGDIIELKPGEKIIIDGILLSNNALIDNSMLTGESEFIELKSGENLISGSINLDFTIRYRATKLLKDSTINQIIDLISNSIKPNLQNKANSISYHFSAFVLGIALITFGLWAYFSDVENALIIGVSVIIIACPCALALATPIATIVGIAESYKKKLLFKDAKFLEICAKCDTIVFDKTGTLTHGTPQVVEASFAKDCNKELLGAFVRMNNHPISNGISQYLSDLITPKTHAIDNFKQINQKGIIGFYNGINLLGGSAEFLNENGIKIENKNDNFMKFYFAQNGELMAVFSLQDSLRNDAKASIAYFLKQRFRVLILSGDRKSVVENIAKELKIGEFHAQQNPIEKSQFIENLHKNGRKIIMVGDGINDAIALNKSDIAISLGQSSDIAIESSDVVLLDNTLFSLVRAHKLAKKTYFVIKQNIKISIIYNCLTIPLACAGFIIPLFAALSMSFSSLLVVLNSLKIKLFAKKI